MSENQFKQVVINSEFITLGQLLKFVDIISFGGEAKDFIMNNECKVNGVETKERGKKIRVGDKVEINNSMFFEIFGNGN